MSNYLILLFNSFSISFALNKVSSLSSNFLLVPTHFISPYLTLSLPFTVIVFLYYLQVFIGYYYSHKFLKIFLSRRYIITANDYSRSHTYIDRQVPRQVREQTTSSTNYFNIASCISLELYGVHSNILVLTFLGSLQGKTVRTFFDRSTRESHRFLYGNFAIFPYKPLKPVYVGGG